MRRPIVIAFASLCLISPRIRAEPCLAMAGLVEGAVAPCSGVLVPPDYPDACSAVTSGLEACRRRRAGDRAYCDARVEAISAKLAAVEASRQAERAAGQAIVTPDRAIDWSAFGWGGGVGAIIVGAIAGGVVYVTR